MRRLLAVVAALLLGVAVVVEVVRVSSPPSDEDVAAVMRERRVEIAAAARQVGDLVAEVGGEISFAGRPVKCGGPPSYSAQFVAGATWTDGPGSQNERIDRLARGVRRLGWEVTISGTDKSGVQYWRFSRDDLDLSFGKAALRGSDDVDVGMEAPCIRVSKEYANFKIPIRAKPLDP